MWSGSTNYATLGENCNIARLTPDPRACFERWKNAKKTDLAIADEARAAELEKAEHSNRSLKMGLGPVLPYPYWQGEKLNMIARIWHGWTTSGNADIYEAMLKDEIFVGIEERRIAGFRSIKLLRREAPAEVEFITIMTFDSLAAVRAFAGEDYETAVVPAKARAVLARFDERSQHYEVRAERGI